MAASLDSVDERSSETADEGSSDSDSSSYTDTTISCEMQGYIEKHKRSVSKKVKKGKNVEKSLNNSDDKESKQTSQKLLNRIPDYAIPQNLIVSEAPSIAKNDQQNILTPTPKWQGKAQNFPDTKSM